MNFLNFENIIGVCTGFLLGREIIRMYREYMADYAIVDENPKTINNIVETLALHTKLINRLKIKVDHHFPDILLYDQIEAIQSRGHEYQIAGNYPYFYAADITDNTMNQPSILDNTIMQLASR